MGFRVESKHGFYPQSTAFTNVKRGSYWVFGEGTLRKEAERERQMVMSSIWSKTAFKGKQRQQAVLADDTLLKQFLCLIFSLASEKSSISWRQKKGDLYAREGEFCLGGLLRGWRSPWSAPWRFYLEVDCNSGLRRWLCLQRACCSVRSENLSLMLSTYLKVWNLSAGEAGTGGSLGLAGQTH